MLGVIRKFVHKLPGERYFGVYRFLPFFFLSGAGLEFCMIHWTAGETNFYKTFKKRQAESIVKDKLDKIARREA